LIWNKDRAVALHQSRRGNSLRSDKIHWLLLSGGRQRRYCRGRRLYCHTNRTKGGSDVQPGRIGHASPSFQDNVGSIFGATDGKRRIICLLHISNEGGLQLSAKCTAGWGCVVNGGRKELKSHSYRSPQRLITYIRL